MKIVWKSIRLVSLLSTERAALSWQPLIAAFDSKTMILWHLTIPYLRKGKYQTRMSPRLSEKAMKFPISNGKYRGLMRIKQELYSTYRSSVYRKLKTKLLSSSFSWENMWPYGSQIIYQLVISVKDEVSMWFIGGIWTDMFVQKLVLSVLFQTGSMALAKEIVHFS